MKMFQCHVSFQGCNAILFRTTILYIIHLHLVGDSFEDLIAFCLEICSVISCQIVWVDPVYPSHGLIQTLATLLAVIFLAQAKMLLSTANQVFSVKQQFHMKLHEITLYLHASNICHRRLP